MGMQNFIKIYQKVQGIGPVSLFSEFEPLQNLDLSQISFDKLIGYILSISMCMQNFITIYQKVQGIRPVSLFSEFEPLQNLDLSQISFDKLTGYILSISLCMQNFITIFFTVLEIGPFSLFQNLALGKASTDDKCHFAIPWARSFQHQIVCKILSKYSKRFNS